MQQFAIHAHVVFGEIGAGAKLSHYLPVHLHAAIEDELLSSAARGKAGLRQDFLQALAALRRLD
jgi:hypothetical protein